MSSVGRRNPTWRRASPALPVALTGHGLRSPMAGYSVLASQAGTRKSRMRSRREHGYGLLHGTVGGHSDSRKGYLVSWLLRDRALIQGNHKDLKIHPRARLR